MKKCKCCRRMLQKKMLTYYHDKWLCAECLAKEKKERG